MKYPLYAILIFVSSTAFAAHSRFSTFTCLVAGFDSKEIRGHCDPDQPKRLFKVPREWAAFDDKLKVGDRVKVAVSDQELAGWLAANPGVKK